MSYFGKTKYDEIYNYFYECLKDDYGGEEFNDEQIAKELGCELFMFLVAYQRRELENNAYPDVRSKMLMMRDITDLFLTQACNKYGQTNLGMMAIDLNWLHRAVMKHAGLTYNYYREKVVHEPSIKDAQDYVANGFYFKDKEQ